MGFESFGDMGIGSGGLSEMVGGGGSGKDKGDDDRGSESRSDFSPSFGEDPSTPEGRSAAQDMASTYGGAQFQEWAPNTGIKDFLDPDTTFEEAVRAVDAADVYGGFGAGSSFSERQQGVLTQDFSLTEKASGFLTGNYATAQKVADLVGVVNPALGFVSHLGITGAVHGKKAAARSAGVTAGATILGKALGPAVSKASGSIGRKVAERLGPHAGFIAAAGAQKVAGGAVVSFSEFITDKALEDRGKGIAPVSREEGSEGLPKITGNLLSPDAGPVALPSLREGFSFEDIVNARNFFSRRISMLQFLKQLSEAK